MHAMRTGPVPPVRPIGARRRSRPFMPCMESLLLMPPSPPFFAPSLWLMASSLVLRNPRVGTSGPRRLKLPGPGSHRGPCPQCHHCTPTPCVRPVRRARPVRRGFGERFAQPVGRVSESARSAWPPSRVFIGPLLESRMQGSLHGNASLPGPDPNGGSTRGLAAGPRPGMAEPAIARGAPPRGGGRQSVAAPTVARWPAIARAGNDPASFWMVCCALSFSGDAGWSEKSREAVPPGLDARETSAPMASRRAFHLQERCGRAAGAPRGCSPTREGHECSGEAPKVWSQTSWRSAMARATSLEVHRHMQGTKGQACPHHAPRVQGQWRCRASSRRPWRERCRARPCETSGQGASGAPAARRARSKARRRTSHEGFLVGRPSAVSAATQAFREPPWNRPGMEIPRGWLQRKDSDASAPCAGDLDPASASARLAGRSGRRASRADRHAERPTAATAMNHGNDSGDCAGAPHPLSRRWSWAACGMAAPAFLA